MPAVEVWKSQVEHQQIRVVLFHQGNDLKPVSCRRHDACAELVGEKRLQSLPRNVVVLGNQNRDEHQ